MKHCFRLVAFGILFSLPAQAQEKVNVSALLKNVPVLCYHQVRDWKSTDSKFTRTYIIPVQTFTQQIQALHDNGYHPILPAQVSNNKPLPTNPVIITFDDGPESQYINALPVLDKFNIKALFFIMTVTIGHKNFMDRAQVKSLVSKGHEVGCHTWNHVQVTKYHSAQDYEIQFQRPKKLLEEITGNPVTFFAYPDGTWNTEAIKQLQQLGYTAAFQLWGKTDESAPAFTVKRILVDGHWDAATLLKRLKNYSTQTK